VVIPFWSTLTLATELLVTASILYIFHEAYWRNKFHRAFVFIVLLYEIIFNISYMLRSMLEHTVSDSMSRTAASPLFMSLAIFHGTFSLIMFLALLVFMFFAWRNYKKEINFFREHKKLTLIFLIAWLLSVISGIAFYFLLYIK
jgi:uncharacterized membrane protein YozB (DUF420 family)